MSIRRRLTEARKQLEAGLKLDGREAALEARLLLQESLNVSHAWLLTHEDDALTDDAARTFEDKLQRRLRGEPVAYILGQREFYGLDLTVSPDTLIPRPDTETLVEAALERIPPNQSCKVLDLGTGTGAIALAIASQRPDAELTAVDFSGKALNIAAGNAKQLNIRNVRFLQSDWFTSLGGETFDIIVSNPPYIAKTDPHLIQGDLRFEPMSALASGSDGLDDIRRIIASAAGHLNQGGWLLLEHGYDQAAAVAELLQQHHFLEIAHKQDLAQITRVSSGQFSC
ncbi:MAG: peptide chain release factor N(5)-glutamine methyltransferase [Betaproteobacteria bacterium HGW-Betaproteobacteria-1]|jgi:release factor glutamine methyltransferase|nr:MAG: peptide chain release factor N(5)-glutamine methyltransferase [Betaproteobacteria bacterium HGW-Betaproteobacteria-1]